MLDTCYFSIAVSPSNVAKMEQEISVVYQEHEWAVSDLEFRDDKGDRIKAGCKRIEVYNASQKGRTMINAAVKHNIPFFGFHGEGHSHGSYLFAGDGFNHISVEGSVIAQKPIALVEPNGKVNKTRAMLYYTIYRRALKFMKVEDPDMNVIGDGLVAVEDKPVCASCKGSCCKLSPKAFSTRQIQEDFGFGSMENGLKNILGLDWIVFDSWIGDTEPSGEYDQIYFPRAKQKYDSGKFSESTGGRCDMLTDTGCILSMQQRPIECQTLIPRIVGVENDGKPITKCVNQVDKEGLIRKWREFQPYIIHLKARYDNGDE